MPHRGPHSRDESIIMADGIAVVTGKAVARIDAPLKVTGKATYTSDVHFEKLVFVVPMSATIAKEKLKSLDISAAEKMKGVIGVYGLGTLCALYRVASDAGAHA